MYQSHNSLVRLIVLTVDSLVAEHFRHLWLSRCECSPKALEVFVRSHIYVNVNINGRSRVNSVSLTHFRSVF